MVKIRKIVAWIKKTSSVAVTKIRKFILIIVKIIKTSTKKGVNGALTWARRSFESAVMKSLGILTRLLYFIKKVDIFFSNIILSVIGISVAIFLLTSENQSFFTQIESFDSIFLAIGGLIGTILALVLTLSIIPIQHAADNFTQSIIRLYREDRLSRYVFTGLSIFCIASFLMIFVKDIICDKVILLIIGFLIVAFSFDLLRFYHRHIIDLLGTDIGITKLCNRTKQKITWFQKRVSFLAKIKSICLTKEEKKSMTQSKIEAVLYTSSSQMINNFKSLIDEMAEIALKAVTRNEIYRAQLALFSLCDIACHYATTRKNNLIIYNEPGMPGILGVKGSDIDKLFTPIYEHYKDISRSAIASRNETTSLHSIKALSRIAIHLTRLGAPSFGKCSVPLTYMPIAYIGVCIENAQRQSCEEVPHQGAKELLEIAKYTPKDTDICDIYLPVLNELHKIALGFLVSNKDALLNSCVEKIMTIAHYAVDNRHFRTDDIIDDVMKKIDGLLPLALSYEKLYGSKFLGQPLTPIFDLSNPVSLGMLIEKATGLIKNDEQKEWVNPYRDFINFNKRVMQHIYDIGKNNEFGDSFILWHILQTIKHIAKVFIQLCNNKSITYNSLHLDELIKCFSWYCSFFWLAFSKKLSINHSHAEEACNISTFIGLNFYKLNNEDLVKFCIDNIAIITDSYRQISQDKKYYNPYDMADLLIFLWYFRMACEKDKKLDIINLIDEKLIKFDVLKPESKEKEAFDNRKMYLQITLKDRPNYFQYDEAIGVLKSLLERQ